LQLRNLAYIVLLAGWICFCYWLYAERIAPRLHGTRETSRPEYAEGVPFPLVFRWGSDIPYAGDTFDALRSQLAGLDSTDEIVVIHSYYFRDEAADQQLLVELGKRRIRNALAYLHIPEDRTVTEVSVQEISADVKSNPFEAVHFERISMAEAIHISPDTFELCFPIRDSLILPGIYTQRLEEWLTSGVGKEAVLMHIVGIADGSGVAEPADMAMERAMRVENLVKQIGWKEDPIELTSGQRSHPLTLRNRSVLIYFE